jgi:hypothetical protein
MHQLHVTMEHIVQTRQNLEPHALQNSIVLLALFRRLRVLRSTIVRRGQLPHLIALQVLTART